MYWWRTPTESLDANSIENLWHELKEYIKRVVKSTLKQELVEGVDTAKYQKYIRHLRKVIPKIIELKGTATGN